jgi:hypothetical protein
VHPKRKICVPASIWASTWNGLKIRGEGVTESAAVWAGYQSGNVERVNEVYFLDDYAGGVQRSGYHRVAVQALTQLFLTLQDRKQVIIADIHTHPTHWVGLSPLDEENPIEFRVGLPAIVLPRFAQPQPALSIAGVHIYKGEGKWRTLKGARKQQLFEFI